MQEKNLIDDRCIIPDYIKEMSVEQLNREIAQLEKELFKDNTGNT